jgi:hypothetical protein
MKIHADIWVDNINSEVKVNPESDIREHLTYPFVDALKTKIDDDLDLPLDTHVDMCIYRINQSKTVSPFLEFLLYLDGSTTDKGGQTLMFPYILSKHTKTGLVDQCTVPLCALFATNDANLDEVIKYSGYFYDKREKRCIMFFNKFYDSDAISIPFVSTRTRWWWTMSSEIFNEHVMMNYPISDTVVSFFSKNPLVMQLKMNDQSLESPITCYAGKHLNYISYMAAFGMKKASTRAHFGPYYYFVNFIDSMKHACYSIRPPHLANIRTDQKHNSRPEPHVLGDGISLTVNEYGKHSKAGITRFAVFLGRCRAFFMNGDEDRSELSMYWANQDPLVQAKLALRDINGNWTRYFTSAYVGEYTFDVGDKTKKRASGWTIKEYDNQIPLSCHEISLTNVPDEYDPNFTDYILL